jgi:PAS domain S-box-containing protein
MKEKLLVLDDESLILSSLKHLFEDDYEVFATTDAEAALGRALEHDIAVILCDERMPGVSGHEFLRRVREISRATRLMMSGYADMSALTEAVNSGQIFAYIHKPWEPPKLKARVGAAALQFKLVQEVDRERRLLRTLMESIPDPIYFKDCQSRFTKVNQAQARILGAKDSAECIGRSNSDYFESEYALPWRLQEEEILTSGQPQVDRIEQFKTSQGAVCWMSTTKVPMFDRAGQVSGIAGISRDITALKNSEDMLREQNEHNRMLLETANDAFIGMDSDGSITAWNPQADLTFGWTAEEAMGRRLCDIVIAPSQREAHAHGIEHFLTGARVSPSDNGASSRPIEMVALHRDGHEFPVEATIWPVRMGGASRFNAFVRDISERRQAEEDLQRAKEAAERANYAKSDFLAAMSHEIRTPMNAILGMSDMLAESQLDAEQMQYVEVFRRAGANLLVLINDILDLSKIEAGHLELEHVDFDLEELVDQAIELAGVKTRAKGIVLMSHLSPRLITALVGDPNRLRQVLVNLLGNAVKFTEAGEVLLTVQNHPSDRSGEVEFSISDTGVGIPFDKLETIFDRFTQADPSITRKYGGTGLGLEISRRLVECMGGILSATSRVGKGSTFRFNVQFERGIQSGRKTPFEITEFRGRRVLVIDDNATNCFILAETMNSWGIESTTFRAPAEALADLSAANEAKRPYSLVLVDSDMPGMDGFETTARIKELAPELPVIMFTSDVRPGDIKRRREAGLSGYAVKPVKRAELLRLICSAMHPHEEAELQVSADAKRPETAPVRPLRILIAEDSADNRLLLEVYLKASPHQLTFVDDGKAAVDRFRTESFDLILMDMQMPVMDGLTATRAIRTIEKQRGAPAIPIVGVTANARPEDVQASAKAGCNQHLSKPISRHKLLSTIEEYGPMTAPVTASPDAPEAESARLIAIEMPTGLEGIVPRYLASRRAELPKMMALLAASDFQRLAVLGHDIKGTGTSYGFPELTRMGAALEHSARQMDTAALTAQLPELKDYLDRVQLFATL